MTLESRTSRRLRLLESSTGIRSEDVFGIHDFSDAAKTLADPKGPRYVMLKGAVRQDFIERLMAELRGGFVQSKTMVNIAKANSRSNYSSVEFSSRLQDLGYHGRGWLSLSFVPHMELLSFVYTEIVHNPLAAAAGFTPVELVDDIHLKGYPPNTGLIEYHLDSDIFIQPTGIITVQGSATARIAPPMPKEAGYGPDKEKEHSFTTVVGDLVLLPGLANGRKLAMFHEFEALEEGRYSIVFGNVR